MRTVQSSELRVSANFLQPIYCIKFILMARRLTAVSLLALDDSRRPVFSANCRRFALSVCSSHLNPHTQCQALADTRKDDANSFTCEGARAQWLGFGWTKRQNQWEVKYARGC